MKGLAELTHLSWTQLVTFAIIIAILVNIVVKFVYNRYQERKLGCEPCLHSSYDYFFGFPTLFDLLRAKKEGTLVEEGRRRHDNEDGSEVDTFELVIAGIKAKSTRDPENLKALLATQFSDFSIGRRRDAFYPLLGNGIFSVDGLGWKHSRAMLRPQFAREQVAHVRTLEPHIQRFAEHVRIHDGSAFEMQELLHRLTLDSSSEFLFGESVESLRDNFIDDSYELIEFEGKEEFGRAFDTAKTFLSSRSFAFNFYFLFDNQEFRHCIALVHKFTEHYVNKALDTDAKALDEHSKNGYIFLYELVKQTRDPKVLRDQLLSILVAGRDTTASLLSFAFYEMASKPSVWEKLKTEIYEAFGSGDNSNIDDITFESLKRCEYLKAVINETLRVYPSVPQNFRIANKATSLPRGGGPDGLSPIYIPKGMAVSFSVYATHRNKSVYGKDANDFRPERWFEPSTKKLGWNYLPFNGGPRVCLGQQYALTEASYVITRLAQMFPNLNSKDKECYPPRTNSQVTMTLKDGVWVALS